jgi:hypothetical protein
MKQPLTHLHWAFRKPHLLLGVTTGVALCGERGVPKDQLTAVAKYSNCTRCKMAYNKREADHASDHHQP